MARPKVQNRHKNDTENNEIGLCLKCGIISRFRIVHIWEGLCGHLKREYSLWPPTYNHCLLILIMNCDFTIFMIRKCWLDETIPKLVQKATNVCGNGRVHKSTAYSFGGAKQPACDYELPMWKWSCFVVLIRLWKRCKINSINQYFIGIVFFGYHLSIYKEEFTFFLTSRAWIIAFDMYNLKNMYNLF